MKDARVPKPRRSGRRPKVYDVVTPSAREARLAAIARRQRRYYRFMIPAICFVGFGFFVPAPVPLRLAALMIATVLGGVAVLLGNAR